MKKIYFFVALLIFFLTHIAINYPLSYEEVKEGYTAFIFEPKILYRTDNYYVSTLGVYLKALSIKLFGLNTFAVRLPNLIAGIFSLFIVWRVSPNIIKNKKQANLLVVVTAFLISFIRVSTDDFGLIFTFGLMLLFLDNLLKKEDVKLFFLLILLFFTSFYNIVFIILVSTGLALKRPVFVLIPLALLFIIISTPLKNFIYQTSIIKFIHPSSYVFTLDNNLSYGVIHDSPLITDSFNFNRLFYNKPSFIIRRVFVWFANIFDYEYLTSFDKANTILAKQNLFTPLPWLYFWEVPLLIYGLYLLFKNANPKIKAFCVFVFLGYFFWGTGAFGLLIPIFLLAYSQLVENLKIKKLYKYAFLVLVIFSFANFLHIFRNAPWQTSLARGSREIWERISEEEISQNQIIITDRIGEGIYFYLFYEQVGRDDFYNKRVLGITTPDGRQRIESVGNVTYRSFDFQKEDKRQGQIWVGFPGEFGGNFKPDEKIENISINNPEMGDSLWVIKYK